MRERSNASIREDGEIRDLKLSREGLLPEQLAQLSADGQFDAIGCDNGKQYRIYYGISISTQ
jgi:hypothetical protein